MSFLEDKILGWLAIRCLLIDSIKENTNFLPYNLTKKTKTTKKTIKNLPHLLKQLL